jgi:anti-sigma regulatory factor (Ser/Thr protein kinase)
MGAALGLSDEVRSNIGIVATELATNVFRHGGGGHFVLRPLNDDGPAGVELLGIDHGPGMANVADCLRDGFSSAGSMGTGLGAMQRIASEFDVYSAPGKGTVVAVRLRTGRRLQPARAAGAVGVCLPKPGETECGDGWTAVMEGARTTICVVDGLGHGPAAADAAAAAAEAFTRSARGGPAEVLEALNLALRSTRGAAVAVAVADAEAESVRYGGIGNISGTILSPASARSMVSHNGIVGHQMRRVQEFDYPWPAGATMLLHSDGLTTHWRAESYPGVLQHDPVLLCALLYRDQTRGRDDTTIVACRAPVH